MQKDFSFFFSFCVFFFIFHTFATPEILDSPRTSDQI